MTSFNDHLHRVYASQDPQALQDAYRDWANRYDADLFAAGYSYFILAVAMVTRHMPETSASILDAGVGTGRIGGYLHALGYRNLSGIDLSTDMLKVAESSGAYRQLRPMNLAERLDFPDNHFAHAYSIGTFTSGHAPPQGLKELARVIRPGGALLVSMTEKPRAEDGYGAMLDGLCDAGILSVGERTQLLPVFPLDPAEQHILGGLEIYWVR